MVFITPQIAKIISVRSTPVRINSLSLSAALIDSYNELDIDSIVVGTPQSSFEPIMPDTSTFVSFGLIVFLCATCWIVWNDQVVPISRKKLANSKRQGGVKKYLDELTDGEDKDSKQFEKWLFADWLNPNKKKEAAVPFLKKAKWNSGDNPVLVASALIGFAVLFASVTERISFMGNM